MIFIKNSQKKIKIDKKLLSKQIQKILDIIDYSDYDLNVLFTTNKNIQKYNKQYRKKDKPTDILSFAYHSNIKPGQKIKPESEEDKNLGDLILSLEYIQEDAPNWDQTFEQRLIILLIHGICHLLGYDHIEDSDHKVMQKKEDFILKKLNL